MKIAVYGPEFNERSHSAIVALFAYLGSKSAEVFVDAHFFNSILEYSSINIKAYTLGTFTTLTCVIALRIVPSPPTLIIRSKESSKSVKVPRVLALIFMLECSRMELKK